MYIAPYTFVATQTSSQTPWTTGLHRSTISSLVSRAKSVTTTTTTTAAATTTRHDFISSCVPCLNVNKSFFVYNFVSHVVALFPNDSPHLPILISHCGIVLLN